MGRFKREGKLDRDEISMRVLGLSIGWALLGPEKKDYIRHYGARTYVREGFEFVSVVFDLRKDGFLGVISWNLIVLWMIPLFFSIHYSDEEWNQLYIIRRKIFLMFPRKEKRISPVFINFHY